MAPNYKHPTYKKMACRAIFVLGGEQKVSRQAITKFILAHYDVPNQICNPLRRALKGMVNDHTIIQDKESFKLTTMTRDTITTSNSNSHVKKYIHSPRKKKKQVLTAQNTETHIPNKYKHPTYKKMALRAMYIFDSNEGGHHGKHSKTAITTFIQAHYDVPDHFGIPLRNALKGMVNDNTIIQEKASFKLTSETAHALKVNL